MLGEMFAEKRQIYPKKKMPSSKWTVAQMIVRVRDCMCDCELLDVYLTFHPRFLLCTFVVVVRITSI